MDIINRPGTSQAGPGMKGAPDNLAAVASRLRTPMYVSDRAMPPEEEILRSIEVSGKELKPSLDHLALYDLSFNPIDKASD
jgi:hypothetical protein